MKFRALLIAFFACFALTPARAAISIVTLGIGGNGSSSSLTNTTTADCPIGSTIILLATQTTVADTLTSVSDSAGNTWAATFDNLSGTGIGLGWGIAINTTVDLPIGGQITANFGGATPNSFTGACIQGLATTSPKDVVGQTSQGLAATSATTVNSGTLAQASEIVLYGLGGATAVGTVTCGSGWTSLSSGVSNTPSARICYQIVASTASVAASPTWGSASNYILDLISLKGSGGAAAAPLASLTTMGVGP